MKSKNRGQLLDFDIKQVWDNNKYRLNGSDVLVFVPVCNEEQSVSTVISEIRRFCNFNIVAIDNGSTDSTCSIIQDLGVAVFKQPTGSNLSVILTGLNIAEELGCQYAIKIDGDGQHNPQDLPRLYEHAVKTGADITIGSRHLNGFKARRLSIAGSGMLFCSFLVSLLSGRRITDTTSGFKAWSLRAYKAAIQASRSGKLREHSTYHVEELIIAAKNRLKVEEISVEMRPRQCGKSKSFAGKKLVLFPLNLIRSTLRALL